MTKIAIIGGGIGGLTTALTLRQFGFEPEVFEQAPELLEVGAAIAVWPNAMRILDRLGIGEEIARHAGTIEQVRWLDSEGKLINSTRLPESDKPAVALHRADLQSVLLHALPERSLHLGKILESFHEESSEIQVRICGWRHNPLRPLIGCDGLHSHVRAQILGDSRPVFRGYTVWRGRLDSPVDPRACSGGEAGGRRLQSFVAGVGTGGRRHPHTPPMSGDAELREYYRSSRVAVVPLRYGAGVKLKVVEALREGPALVTTPTGAQGLPGSTRWHRSATVRAASRCRLPVAAR